MGTRWTFHFNRHIAPRFLHCGASSAARRMVAPAARGGVVQIGVGSDHNRDLYDFMKIEAVDVDLSRRQK
jgi:hypothetical protein